MLLSVVGIIFSGASIQEVYAADGDRVESVAFRVTGDGGSLFSSDKGSKDTDPMPNLISIDGDTATLAPRDVANGQIVTITPGPDTKKIAFGEFDTEIIITIDETPLTVTDAGTPRDPPDPQKLGGNLHTSCSKDVIADDPINFIEGTVVGADPFFLLVVGKFSDDQLDPCAPDAVPPDPVPPGATGMTGMTGMTGDAGATGMTGMSGTDGTDGDAGATGATGASGTDGDAGATGMTGMSGADGDDGAVGMTGMTGASGADGPVPPGGIGVDRVFIAFSSDQSIGAGKSEYNGLGNTGGDHEDVAIPLPYGGSITDIVGRTDTAFEGNEGIRFEVWIQGTDDSATNNKTPQFTGLFCEVTEATFMGLGCAMRVDAGTIPFDVVDSVSVFVINGPGDSKGQQTIASASVGFATTLNPLP